MSIVDEITRLTSAKANIKAAIEAKGVSVPSSAKLDAFPSYVSQIESGGGEITWDNIAMKSYGGVVAHGDAAYIASSAFSGARGITAASFPYATAIRDDAFALCTSLSFAYFPNVSSIGRSVFYGTDLRSGIFTSLRYVGASAFYGLLSLTEINLPNLYLCYSSAFRGCNHLSAVYAGASVSSAVYIYPNVFGGCMSLASFYLLAPSRGQISNVNVFARTPLSDSSYLGYYGSIFVPASLLADYQASTNWAAYSSRFVGLTDEEIAELPI